ncbi:2-dehydro-3-deoxyphosphooctonate aldolase (KDO 8-P synthase) [Methanolobus vulcani]|uniref:3-deoxy-8-phosphooctulonate synthase n=1 Tax=Methanolobus vulcani TaxID=38026 RepID=A0A7Z7AVJ2_9EURY|nr:3-deoxy-8-phosphooctulonate synthase [Methanolobus vulcani]SDF58120.1 2-dehydro-3-deoxyphosphooctonate aldolase (KDO 8-P synthase) [Methanolobus vulcani]
MGMIDTQQKSVRIGNIVFNNNNPFILIGGPCVIESEEHTFYMAREISKITNELNIPFIFKCSFDKANRSSVDSFRGPGIDEGLRILKKVKTELNIPVISDVHTEEQIPKAVEVLDIVQVPAFLCRQTDLLVNIAKYNVVVNVKKGQFLAPWDMQSVIGKIESQGNHNILLTERGVTFGYNNLVSDMRSLVVMKETGYPVVYDGTHSVQLPGGLGCASGGQSEFIPHLCRAAVAVGVSSVFLEIHNNPTEAKCDGPNVLNLKNLKELLKQLKMIDSVVKN